MKKAVVVSALKLDTKEEGWMVRVYLNWPKRASKYVKAFFENKKEAKKVANEINLNN